MVLLESLMPVHLWLNVLGGARVASRCQLAQLLAGLDKISTPLVIEHSNGHWNVHNVPHGFHAHGLDLSSPDQTSPFRETDGTL